MGLALNSIKSTLLSKGVQDLFYALECGHITLDDFENIFTHFYNKKVIFIFFNG